MGFDVVGVLECFPSFFKKISSTDFTFLLKRVHILFLQVFNSCYI